MRKVQQISDVYYTKADADTALIFQASQTGFLGGRVFHSAKDRILGQWIMQSFHECAPDMPLGHDGLGGRICYLTTGIAKACGIDSALCG